MTDGQKSPFVFSPFQSTLLLVFLGLLVFANSFSNPFIHDDKFFILQNQNIGSLDLSSIFFPAHQAGIEGFDSAINAYYRPMVELWYRLIYKICGMNPFGFHAANVFLHILNTLLLFALLRKLWNNQELLAFGVSLIFLIHPLQAQTVAPIAGAFNLLCVFFLLLAWNGYMNFKSERKTAQAVGCGIFFLLALLSKEQAAIFPALLVVYELLFRESPHKSKNRSIILWVGIIGALIIYFLLRNSISGNMLGTSFQWDAETKRRLLTIPRIILMFIGLVFIPVDLHYYRTVNILEPWMGFAGMFAALVVGLVILTRQLQGEPRRVFIFGLAWFFIALAPVVNVIPLVVEYSYILTMEHFIYFPLVGLLIALGSLWSFLYTWGPIKRIAIFLLAAIIFPFSLLTIQVNRTWSSEIGLWKRTLKLGNPLGRGYQLLGKAYAEEKMHAEAILEYYKALLVMQGYEKKATAAVKPVYRNFIKDIYFDIGSSFQALGNHPAALSYFLESNGLDGRDPRVLTNIGISYVYLKDFDKAKRFFREALAVDGQYLWAMNNLGVCYLKEGSYPEAREMFEAILKINPRWKSAQENLKWLNHHKQSN